MADTKTTAVVDHNKFDGKPAVEFSPEFKPSFEKAIKTYDDTLDHLQSLVSGKGFSEEYGICNCRYDMRYITPNDISEYISKLFTAISMKLVACDIADLEKFSVEMAKVFISKNMGDCVAPDNVFAKGTYPDERNMTLMDLLVQTENTFFDRCVYSQDEMEGRAKDAKKDYETINKMHFGATMKAIVNKLPDVIKTSMKENASFVCCNCETVMTYIETFILFTVSLNTCMLTQMIGYCEPMTTYLRKDKENVVTQESVSTRGNKPVYVVLVSGTNIVSKTIKKFTNSKWSHAAISFDPGLEHLYSYTFATTEYAPASQGLRRESIKMLNNIAGEICVYGFYAPNRSVNDMKQAIKDRIDSGKTKYDLGLLVKKAFNDNAAESTDNNKKICSAFVNSIIGEFIGKISDKASPSPDDMSKALANMNSNEFVKLYEGPCTMYDSAAVTTRLKRFAKNADTKTFSEYVTEFCIIKPDMRIHSRMPFDCNMRNIVLQDCTPNFKDTRSALHFIMKDSRSPIHAMLVEAASVKKVPDRFSCSSTLQMFEPYFRPCCGNHNGPLGFEYDRAGFLTDVNWLDKIAYGNNFMDGNYRMDTLGNENRHPIAITLKMLHRMYCGCSLKTNEELANNLMKIAGVMMAVINEQPWNCANKDLVKDILAVLGECFTRNVIKLYDNHCTIITYSDDMKDTMIPGYTYCESFVYMEDGTTAGAKPDPPTVSFTDQKTGQQTVPKTGVLNKLATVMRQFIEWIQKKLANISPLFSKINGAKVQWVNAHKKTNDEVSKAIQNNRFSPIMKNFPLYNIPLNDIKSRTDAVRNALQTYQDEDTPVDAVAIKKEILPGDDNTRAQLAAMTDTKQLAQAVQNYTLYGKINPGADVSFSGALPVDKWNTLVNDLMNSQKLVDETCKVMVKSLQDGMKVLEQIRKKEEAAAQKPATTESAEPDVNGDLFQEADNNNGGTTSRAQQLFDIFQQCAQIYHINVMNAITNIFFNTSYRIYTEILKGYQSGNYVKPEEQPQAPVAPAPGTEQK